MKILFQFHKVRLKEILTFRISASSLFQFHKVRLKVRIKSFSRLLALFQFHKVRLKVIMIAVVLDIAVVSIP